MTLISFIDYKNMDIKTSPCIETIWKRSFKISWYVNVELNSTKSVGGGGQSDGLSSSQRRGHQTVQTALFCSQRREHHTALYCSQRRDHQTVLSLSQRRDHQTALFSSERREHQTALTDAALADAPSLSMVLKRVVKRRFRSKCQILEALDNLAFTVEVNLTARNSISQLFHI